jgi:hypothetical protein
MRLLSLDFDGPFHPVSAIADKANSVSGVELDNLVVERELFRWLPILEEELAEHPDVLLAVHSNWRKYASNAQIRAWLAAANLADRFVGVTRLDLPRQRGIEELATRAGVEHLKVLDDDNEQFDADYEPLLLVDPELGISDMGIRAALSGWLHETSPTPTVVSRP